MIEKIDAPFKMPETLSSGGLVLLCMSDLEALDEYGEPTFTPTLSDLVEGAKGTLDVKRSFIRSHRMSLFNRARGGFDGEHQLITKGSVLVFKDVEGLDTEKLEAGIGINKQLGFGQVWTNPNWLAMPTLTLPLFQTAQLQRQTESKVKIADSPFIRFVKNQAGLDEQAMKNKQVAQSMLQQAVNAYYQARIYNHIINAYDAGPSSSQLRRVAEVYRSSGSNPLATLFDGEHAICKAKNDDFGWGVAWDNGKQFVTFAQAFKVILGGKSAKQVELFIELLCRYEPCQFRSLNKLVQEQNLTKVQSLQEAK
jgi:CRISPR-associated protein Csx10